MKILIVDDNKMLAKAIARKVAEAIGCDIDVAHDASSAREMMAANEYFAALLDLCLPDAMHGEVVDYALEQKVPSIVLTGLDDDETRDKFMDKPIIDYVLKEGAGCISYIIDIIERLRLNKATKIIIAEDSMPVRSLIKSTLQAYNFEVYAAAHGEEALNYLQMHPDTKVIITDKEMPVVSGEELIKQVRKSYDKSELSIIVLTAHGDERTSARMLKLGANDFISKPFARESLICRINNHIDILSYIERVKEASEKDFMTKLKNRKSFYDHANDYLAQLGDSERYCVMMIDIDRFKSINDTYGHDAGDAVIVRAAELLTDATRGADIVARFGGEEFCLLLKDIAPEDAHKLAEKMRQDAESIAVSTPSGMVSFTISIGVYNADKFDQLDDAIKLADQALFDAKNDGRNMVVVSAD